MNLKLMLVLMLSGAFVGSLLSFVLGAIFAYLVGNSGEIVISQYGSFFGIIWGALWMVLLGVILGPFNKRRIISKAVQSSGDVYHREREHIKKWGLSDLARAIRFSEIIEMREKITKIVGRIHVAPTGAVLGAIYGALFGAIVSAFFVTFDGNFPESLSEALIESFASVGAFVWTLIKAPIIKAPITSLFLISLAAIFGIRLLKTEKNKNGDKGEGGGDS